jgi:dolichol-phosphate mannosyltransferase
LATHRISPFPFTTIGIFSFSNKPLYFILYSGLVLFFFSFISIIYYILAFFLDLTLPKGWSSLIVAIFFFGSIQLIFIGILGVYIAKIFDEIKKRPSFLISEIVEKEY